MFGTHPSNHLAASRDFFSSRRPRKSLDSAVYAVMRVDRAAARLLSSRGDALLSPGALFRAARLPPMRPVRTPKQVRDRRRARAAEKRALEALAAQLRVANVGALGRESPSSPPTPPATVLPSADRDDPPADPREALRLLQRECASLRAHARTVDARVQREVEAAAAIAAEKAADDAHAALERRLAETARALDDARVARADAEARAAHAEGSTDVVRARHAEEISAAVADAVAAERARGAETLRLAAAAAAAAAAADAEPSSEEQDEVIERLRVELARAREETVRARADAEAAARNNVGAAIVADAVRAASDATLDEDARGLVADAASLDAAVEAYARATGATWRAEAGGSPIVAWRRGALHPFAAERGASGLRGGTDDAARARETIRRVAASVRAAATRVAAGEDSGALVFT